MGRLREIEKRELLEDSKSIKRKEDFRKLEEGRYRGFSLEWLEEITEILKTNYPRNIIKADKNRL